MTVAELLALMATMHCQSMVMDIPERRETVVQTMCVRTEVIPLKEKAAPVTVEAPKKPVVKATPKKKVTRCKRKYYWKNHRKYWRCVR